jgi:hypothetical protein
MNPSTCKLQRRGTFDGYEVAGWQQPDNASWKVKVWLAGSPRDWFGYTVTAGMFELKTHAHAHREAVLHAIGELGGRDFGRRQGSSGHDLTCSSACTDMQ